MTLGENIAHLRGEKNMSQGDLAEALNVSRQSVSKWETDGSVPELERLTRMSELFGVSLDELVKGKTAEKETPPTPEPPVHPVASARQIVGVVLLALGGAALLVPLLLGGDLLSLVYAMPFWACGAVCLLAKQRVRLWTGWALVLSLDFFFQVMTGNRWTNLLGILATPAYRKFAFQSWGLNLPIMFAQALGLLLMIFLTLRSFRYERRAPTVRQKVLLAAGWAAYVLRWAVPYTSPFLKFQSRFYTQPLPLIAFRVWDALLGCVFLALLVWLLVATSAALRWKAEEKTTV